MYDTVCSNPYCNKLLIVIAINGHFITISEHLCNKLKFYYNNVYMFIVTVILLTLRNLLQ